MPVMESKAADVFAFGMFAVEVFTGKIPFEEQKNEAAVLRISQGGRPEMPENSRVMGLTVEVWNVLESCWRQDPKKRPTMGEVARRWEKFVGEDDVLNALPECVQTNLVISTSSSIQFPTFCNWFRVREYVAEKGETPSRRRVKTTAIPSLQEKAEPRFRSLSENPGLRTIPKLGRLRTGSRVVKAGTGLGAIPQSPDSNFQQTPNSEVAQQHPKVVSQPETQVFDPPPSESVVPRGCQIPMLKYVHNSTEGQENVLRDHVISCNWILFRMPL